jgi:hypothetical protein
MGSSGGSGEHFLRQLSSSDGDGGAPHQLLQQEWECGGGSRRGSRRWSRKKARARGHRRGGGFCRTDEAAAGRKRVMVVVDQSSGAKHAMMWALTHVASKGDFLTLLHVLPPQSGSSGGGAGGRGGGVDASALANSLGALCKACKPEVRALLRLFVHDAHYFLFLCCFAACFCKYHAPTHSKQIRLVSRFFWWGSEGSVLR